MPGNRTGALKIAAKRLGLSLDDYLNRIKGGQKWCTRCREWHSVGDFISDPSRADGINPNCRKTRKDEKLLSYLAGCIDCDGFISISVRNRNRADGSPNQHYIAILGLGQVTPLIPRLMKETFGGTVNEYHYKNREFSKVNYLWQVTNLSAAQGIKIIRPYLRLKVQQADLALEFCKRIHPQMFGRPLSEEERLERARLHREISSLNSPRGRARRDRKGGIPSEWPAGIGVREYPAQERP